MKLEKNGRNIIRICVLSAVIIFVMVLTSQMIGLGSSGFDTTEVLQQFWFYVAPALGFLLGIIVLFVVELTITEGDKEYGNSLCFNSTDDSPSLIGQASFLNTWPRLTLLSILIVSILGLIQFSVGGQTTFTGIGVLTQQFTETGSVLYSSALIPAAENLGAAFMFAFFLFTLRYYSRKFKIGMPAFIILAIVLAMVTFGAYGYINHQLRYSESEIALTTTLAFWAIGGLITVITGSFIPFWIIHIGNNLFFTLAKFSSVDVVQGWIIGIILLCITLYALTFIGKRRK